MLTGMWKNGLACLLSCLFVGSVFASASAPANFLEGTSPAGRSSDIKNSPSAGDAHHSAQGAVTACVIGEGRWGGGPPGDAERWSDANEDLMVVGAGADVIVFDISTPTAPLELGRALVNFQVVRVAISADGTMVAASDSFDNIKLVDISNRNSPVVRGGFAWPGAPQPRGMEFDGNYLYVGVRYIGLTVLDISDPDTPTFVANSDGTVSGIVVDVALYGDYAYIGQASDGLEVVDISDPSNPHVVASHPEWSGAGKLTIEGNRVFVARGGEGFSILDLTNPGVPLHLGTFEPSNAFSTDTALLPGDLLVVALSLKGTEVYDISTPATPILAGSFSTNSTGAFPIKLVTVDDQVFTVPNTFANPSIQLVDFQTPASPVETGRIDFDGRSTEASVGVNHILVANNSGGVVMLDTTNPVAPTVVGRVDPGFSVLRIGHVNGYGVTGRGFNHQFSVIDPQPSGPTLVTTFDNQFSTNDLVGVGTELYIASGSSGGLRIYDMSNPPAPQFLGSVVLPGQTIHRVAVSGDYAYTGWVNDTNLQVINVSDPAAPFAVGNPYTLPDEGFGGGGANAIAVSGSTVFVGTTLYGVRILHHDVSDTLNPLSFITYIDVAPAGVTGVSVDGDFLYISTGVYSGLLVYDVSDPSNPQLLEEHNTDGEANDVDAANGVIAMAEGDSGVSTFGCDLAASNQPPVKVGTIGTQSSDEGETLFPPFSTSASFNDPDGQALTYSATGLPPGLSIDAVSGEVDGSLDYDSSGSYSVVITATDPFGLFVAQSFTWTINEANAPPEVISDIADQSSNTGDSVSLDVHTHFSDHDGDTLRFEAGNLPNGLSMDGTSGVISGILAGDSSGNYIVLVLAFDPDDAVATQTFNWTVINTNPLLFQDGFE